MTGWYAVEPRIGPGGDAGGDRQVTDALSLRYWHTDRLDAVVTVYVYGVAADDDGNGPYRVEIQTEMTLCTDRRDPGTTEQWADARHSTLPATYPTVAAVQQAARDTATTHTASLIAWNGRIPGDNS